MNTVSSDGECAFVTKEVNAHAAFPHPRSRADRVVDVAAFRQIDLVVLIHGVPVKALTPAYSQHYTYGIL